MLRFIRAEPTHPPPPRNVIIPLAIYAQRRNLTEAWVDRKSSRADLERIRKFVYRSLIKKEFWTGANRPPCCSCAGTS